MQISSDNFIFFLAFLPPFLFFELFLLFSLSVICPPFFHSLFLCPHLRKYLVNSQLTVHHHPAQIYIYPNCPSSFTDSLNLFAHTLHSQFNILFLSFTFHWLTDTCCTSRNLTVLLQHIIHLFKHIFSHFKHAYISHYFVFFF